MVNPNGEITCRPRDCPPFKNAAISGQVYWLVGWIKRDTVAAQRKQADYAVKRLIFNGKFPYLPWILKKAFRTNRRRTSKKHVQEFRQQKKAFLKEKENFTMSWGWKKRNDLPGKSNSFFAFQSLPATLFPQKPVNGKPQRWNNLPAEGLPTFQERG